MVPACNRGFDNHFIVLSHYNITLKTQSYDIPPGHIILATGQPGNPAVNILTAGFRKNWAIPAVSVAKHNTTGT